ncbi:MAG: HAD family hydrolase [Firmicutes bacterium]|nr:HAD family hydrolase [Bacillota bacterium]
MKAVLFDLDETLLRIDFDRFMHQYLEAISRYFSNYLEPKIFVQELLNGVEVMLKTNDPQRTIIEVFADYFFSSTGLDPNLMQKFTQFYLDEFPKLAHVSQEIPEAKEVIKTAFDKGYKVVIATNPVFPSEAIHERLRWAKVSHFDYDLITSGDNMHSCKPHLTYYQEIAQIIDVPPEQCLMVGDDIENDGPAAKIGMKTFLLTNGRKLIDVVSIL